jgi:hypothetical protein
MGKKIKIRDKIILSLFCIVLGGVFVAIGVYVWYGQLTPYFQVRQSISWQPVQATLLDAKVFDDWSEPGRTKRGGIKYFIDIRYQYSFNNKNYTFDFLWTCGNGHTIGAENVFTLTFESPSPSFVLDESIFEILSSSSIIYGDSDADITELKKSDVFVWFYE